MDQNTCLIINILTDTVINNITEKGNNLSTCRQYLEMRRRKIKRLVALVRLTEPIPKVQKYLDVIHSMPSHTFFEHFRMERKTFWKLMHEVEPLIERYRIGRPGMSDELCLYAVIWYLSNGACHRDLADRFGVSKSTTHKIVLKYCKILTLLSKSCIRWPTKEEHTKIVDGFNRNSISNFPNISGAVDGTHIRINQPKLDQSSYYNRKGYHSILMQGICDNDLVFIDIFVGWPGRAHDACVWQNSPIGKSLAEGSINLPTNSHLVGDSAYPLKTYLMVPFKDFGNLSAKEKKYNQSLSSKRVVIEHAFGVLKNKFKILNFINAKTMKSITHIVTACVVLHNFIIQSENIQRPTIVADDNSVILDDHPDDNNFDHEA